jgi:CHAT domain-containing protein/tetratricopeptide (TPR) repeat protein
MSQPKLGQQYIQAFLEHDYERCLTLYPELIKGSPTLGVTAMPLLLCLISCQRLGYVDAAEQLGEDFIRQQEQMARYSLLGHQGGWLLPLEEEFLRLTLGTSSIEQVLAKTETDLERCRANYYAAARLLTEGRREEARERLEACLATEVDFFERGLAVAEYHELSSIVRPARERRPPPDIMRQREQLVQQIRECWTQGRLQEVLDLCRQAVELDREHFGGSSGEYAVSLDNLAYAQFQVGDYDAAESNWKECLRIIRDNVGEGDYLYAERVGKLAVLYDRIGKHSEAGPLHDQADAALASFPDEGNTETLQRLSRCVHELGKFYDDCGDYQRAEPLYRRALVLRRKALGPQHGDTLTSLFRLGDILRVLGRTESAESFLQEAAELARELEGDRGDRYADRINSIALFYISLGKYIKAKSLLDKILSIYREKHGTEHWLYGQTLENLSEVLRLMGDFNAALGAALRASEIYRAALGEGHQRYADSLNCLGGLYSLLNNFDAAEPLFREALEICGRNKGSRHPKYMECLNNLAIVLMNRGDHAAAEALLRQGLEICRNTLGELHPEYAGRLHNLGVSYHQQGRPDEAEPILRQALEIKRMAYGDHHPDVGLTLSQLAVLTAGTGRVDESFRLCRQIHAIEDRMMNEVYSIASERQRLEHLQVTQVHLEFFLSLIIGHMAQDTEAVQIALDLVLRRKAITAEALATQRDAVMGGKYPTLEPKLRESAFLRMQIARKTLAGPGPEGLESHLRGLAEWNARKERLEAELARQIPEMNLEQKLRAADRRAVALGLSEGVALVEFVRLRVFDFKAVPARGEARSKPARYVAFVLRAGDPDEPRLIDLGEAEPIDRLIADFRAGIIAEAGAGDGRDMAKRREEVPPTAESNAGLALRATLFDGLALVLRSRTRLLIAPDGDLTRLPFETLPTADGRRLIDDYQISYLSCGRDVLRFGTGVTGQPREPLIVADPAFDLEARIPTGPVPAQPGFWSRLLGRGKKAIETPRPTVPTQEAAGRHSRDLDRDRSAYHFHRLPGTRAEGERVATRLGVSPWLDAAALEGRLKTACRSPRILHLATHGFFLPDQERGFSAATDGPGRLSGLMIENPMLRSGLALAGANTWLKAGNPPEEAEDGLLTAEDVTGLDLLATELVVLSACETGLGQVHVGEGVFGLRRAFVLAGAKTLVMSLWKVPDEPTRELMEDFYRRLLAGQGRAEALREAQLALKMKYPEPFYWGAFICQGDPSPLSMVRPGIAGTGVAAD